MAINSVLPEALRKQMITDNWPKRRRWMKVWTISFGVNMQAIVVDAIWRGGNNLEVQIFMSLATAVVSVLFMYVFGATWDDHSKRKLLGGFLDSRTAAQDGADDAAGDAQEATATPDTGGQNKPAAAD